MQQQGRLVNVKGLVYSWQVKNVRARLIALSVSSLLLSILTPISIPQATAAPALVTCVNIESGAERISRTGNCRIGREAQANWHKNQTDSPIASGTSAKVIVICSNKESSPVAYQVIRKKCARHQVSTLFSRSGSLPAKPVIAEAVSYGHDNASLKLAADPAAGLDAPVAYYTITIRNVDTSTATKIETKRIYSWRDLGLIVGGLQGRTTYTFTVTATTVDGTSAVSIASIPVTTPAYVPPASSSSSSGSTLAVPAFTLSSTSETKMVNNAISGYTISSTGGAIASYAISPAAPAGLTFNTATGLLSGTPTATQSATTYTITATNASGSATATFALTVSSSAPSFFLSSTSETRVATIALAGYTIDASAGAAVTSYSLVGTLPSGLNFSTSNGRITGTPTETRTATTYTIIGTSASGETATATYRLRVTGDVGDVGPGGGLIFYYLAAGFACGPNHTETASATGGKCKWLEVAPSGWYSVSGDPSLKWANGTDASIDLAGVANDGSAYNNALGVGLGYRNSIAIVNQSNDTTTAAGVSRAYAGGSLSDWYLPNTAELKLLGQWNRGVTQNLSANPDTGGAVNSSTFGASSAGIENAAAYHASSEHDASKSWGAIISSGAQGNGLKTVSARVRPIRAF
jgi:hypothetical protein